MTKDQDPWLRSERKQGFSVDPFHVRVVVWLVFFSLGSCILEISADVLQLLDLYKFQGVSEPKMIQW